VTDDDDKLFASDEEAALMFSSMSLSNGTTHDPEELTVEKLLEAQRETLAKVEQPWRDFIHPIEAAAREAGIHWMRNELVPLESTDADGSKVPVLCWRIERSIHVHPDRVVMWLAVLKKHVDSGTLANLADELGLNKPLGRSPMEAWQP
jgi:hypothetical protein